MKIVYIAGPISAKVQMTFLINVKNGIQLACYAIEHGYAPICPFLDFHYVLAGCAVSIKMLQDIACVHLLKCDEMWILPNYQKSKGTLKEMDLARQHGIPIYFKYPDGSPFSFSRGIINNIYD